MVQGGSEQNDCVFARDWVGMEDNTHICFLIGINIVDGPKCAEAKRLRRFFAWSGSICKENMHNA